MKRRTLIALLCLTIPTHAQSHSPAPKPIPSFALDAPNWQQEAGGHMEFEVASIRENHPDAQHWVPMSSNFPLGTTRLYNNTGGLFSLKNASMIDIIDFAFYLTGLQGNRNIQPQLPGWAQTATFDIEARAPAGATPTKNQMRLMVQSLLADRFHLVAHADSRVTSVYLVRLVQPGVTGPLLKPHPADQPCIYANGNKPTNPVGLQPVVTDGLPPECGYIRRVPDDKNDFRFAGRGVPIFEICKMLTVWINDGRPVLNQTGLDGLYDLSVGYTPHLSPDAPPGAAFDAQYAFNSYGPELVTALKKQLGLKVNLAKAPVLSLTIDHIERPSDN